MKKILKLILICIFSLLVLGIFAIILLTQFINPNDYKTKIENLVKSQTGYELIIQGNIAWQLYPSLGLSVTEVNLSNPKNSPHPTIASIEQAEVNLELLPLLEKNIIINNINFVRPNLYFSKSQPEALYLPGILANDEVNIKHPQQKNENKFKFNVKSLTLEDATIHWLNQDASPIFKFVYVNLKVRDFKLKQAFPIKLSFGIDNKEQTITGDINLDSSLYIDLDQQQFHFDKTNIDFTINKTPYANKPLNFAAHFDALDYYQKTSEFKLENALLNYDAINFDININSNIQNNQTYYFGDVKMPQTNLRPLILAINPNIKPHLDKNTYKNSKLNFEFKGPMENIGFNLNDWQIDNMRIESQGSLKNLFSKPELVFNLTFSELNLDKYMLFAPFVSNNYKPNNHELQKQNQVVKQVSQPISKPTLDNKNTWEVRSNIRIRRFKAANLIAGNLTAKLLYKNQILEIKPIKALAYNGQFESSFKANFAQPTPSWQLEQTLTNVNLQDLLNDYTGEGKLSGIASLELKLASIISPEQSYKENLDGNLYLLVKNGFYNGVDIASSWLTAKKLFGSNVPNIEHKEGTEISHMSGQFNIQHGIATSNNFQLYNPYIFTAGKGDIDLVNDAINFDLTTFESKAVRQNGRTIYQPRDDIGMPINIGCKLSSPCVSVDSKELSKMLIKHGINRGLNKLFDNKDEKRKPIEHFIRGLISN